jgi:hypothetical protein
MGHKEQDNMPVTVRLKKGVEHPVSFAIKRIVTDEVTGVKSYEFDRYEICKETPEHVFSDEDLKRPEIQRQVRSFIEETKTGTKTIKFPDPDHPGKWMKKVVPDNGALGQWIEVVDKDGKLITSVPAAK